MFASPLVDVAGRKRSPATVPGYHMAARRATRVDAIRPTRPEWKRSWPSCAKPDPASQATGSAG